MTEHLPPPPPHLRPQQPHVPYAAALGGGAIRGIRIFNWGIFLWSMLILGIWLIFMTLVMPQFRESLTDFKLELPAPTRILFAMDAFLRKGGFVAVLAVPVVLGFVAGPLSPPARWMVRLLLTLLLAGLVVFSILAVVLPLTALMEALGSSGKR